MSPSQFYSNLTGAQMEFLRDVIVLIIKTFNG